MSRLVSVEFRDDIAVLTILNPPVNAMTRAVVAGLHEALTEVESRDGLLGTVITGSGKLFVAGADIREIEQITRGEREADMDYLNQLLARVESQPKPVVMAINGAALGIGLEFAMAGHWRLLDHQAQVGQPEVNLGLIPGAGGTQRLPRLAGMAKALEMIVYGAPLHAHAAQSAGIVDKTVHGDVVLAAIRLLHSGVTVRRTADRECPKVDPALFAEFRAGAKAKLRGQVAPQRAVDALEAAQCPHTFAEGLAQEATLFRQCLQGEQAKAMVYQFFAEREAGRIPGLGKDTKPLPVHHVGIAGAGTMGCGIAAACLAAGLPVTLWDANGAALATARERIATLNRGTAESLTIAHEPIELATADLVLEAVFEDAAIKQSVFRELDAVLRPHALLATNTSTLDVDALAAATSRPHAVCGIHFFAPAHKMKLVEVVRGAQTSLETLETALQFARRLRKIPVVSANRKGFIGNRVFAAYLREALLLHAEGAAVEEIDHALEDWGMAMGPFAVMDLSGLDVWAAVFRELGDFSPNPLPAMVAAGRLGQKSGAGFYSYPRQRRLTGPGEVRLAKRCLAALAREGDRAVAEGVALRASDIDVAFVNGYGFPRWRGGPMHWGVEAGLIRR